MIGIMDAVINGIRLHYNVYGPDHGYPLLFIHGFLLSGEMWSPIVDALREQYRLIIPDLRGFGSSQVAAHVEPMVIPAASIAEYADDLALLLDHLHEQRPAVVIGLSMGGYIAFEFFQRHAARVLAMVLADTRAEADTDQRRAERYEMAARALAEGSSVVADAIINNSFGPHAPAEMKRQWYEVMSRNAPHGVAAALNAAAGRADSTDLLRAINCPVLLIVGEHDTVTPLAGMQRMQQRIRLSQLTVIPGAGHLPPIEQPERFAEALQQFLLEVVPSEYTGAAVP